MCQKKEKIMESVKKLIIVGFGQRGQIYANYARSAPDKFAVAAVVEIDGERREIAHRQYGCPVFQDLPSLFEAEIQADAAVISVQDCDHKEYAIQCMEHNYDILLEKPIACNLQDCLEIERAQKRYGCRVVVCHVLRYTPFYSGIKEVLDRGELGEIISINASENVGYWHQAHSFVRGPWRNSGESVPMIVAKCCHDMDIIRWFMGKPCTRVSSFGSLSYFIEKNAPEESALYCSDCPIKDCIYNAQVFYLTHPSWAKYFHQSEERSVTDDLRHSRYDRCVFKSENDVVDHEVTIMEFENGATACHTMTAFSKDIYRDIKIHGTKGELVGVVESNRFEVRLFGGETKVYDISEAAVGGHCGGDIGLRNELYDVLCDRVNKNTSFLEVSVDSHRMAFQAENSRISGEVKKYEFI